jgi:hypothetical protein
MPCLENIRAGQDVLRMSEVHKNRRIYIKVYPASKECLNPKRKGTY